MHGLKSIRCAVYLCFVHSSEAELEYLKIAQDLEMYGISYFQIRVSYRCTRL